MQVNSDFRDLLSEFNAAQVRYLLVGGYAFALYAEPRFTKDIDLWTDATRENAKRVWAALVAFGAPLADVRPNDFATPGTIFQMGVPPNRIDIITSVTGVAFETAWKNRGPSSYGDEPIWVIGPKELERNKRATGRPKDLEDVAQLKRAQEHRAQIRKATKRPSRKP